VCHPVVSDTPNPVETRRIAGEWPENLLWMLTVCKEMPECENCGSFVTEAYVRVFTPDGHTGPRVCPFCEDKLRDGAEVREARSSRS